MGYHNLGRPSDKHIDNQELDALVPSYPGKGSEADDRAYLRDAKDHAESCLECSQRVRQYSLLVEQCSVGAANWVPAGVDCPEGIDWYEVAAGLWPELKASQLIMHAAMCDHCGPLLREAARMECDPSPQEERLLEQLSRPSRPVGRTRKTWRLTTWPAMGWATLALVLIVIVGLAGTRRLSSPAALSAGEFSEVAVATHRQRLLGNLALDVHLDSQQAINQWLKVESPFPLELPASPAAPGEELAYRPNGARLVDVGGKKGAFIAYQAQPVETTSNRRPEPVSLLVIPASITMASGGVEVRYPKVSFHYATLRGFRVVTWSQHGLTYALVSQESNGSQRSCMVCHSAMRDRDLSHTPAPISQRDQVVPIL